MDTNGRIRTLLVDCHDAFLDSAERFLRCLGGVAVIGRADNDIDALRLCEQLRPELVLLGMMPGADGLGAARAIKARSEAPFVLVATYYDDALQRGRATEAGADAFISKLSFAQDVVPIVRRLAQEKCHV